MLKQGSHFFFTGTFFRHLEKGNGVDANSASKNAEPHNGLSTKSNSFSSDDDDDDDDDDELSGSEKLLDNDT